MARGFIAALACALYGFGLTLAAANFAIFQAASAAPDIVYDITASPFNATCNGVADDAAAFDSFNSTANTYQAGHPGAFIELLIPAGKSCALKTVVGNSQNFTQGLKHVLVAGAGSASSSLGDGGGAGFFFGGGIKAGISQVTANAFALVNTVTAGSSCVTAITAGDASKWSIGDWAIITGDDIQGNGFPPNVQFWEYVKVTSANAGTGQVCFALPLKYTYKSNWPSYTTGQTPYLGGPATLYAFDNQFWDIQVEYRGLTMTQAGQAVGPGRDLTFTDVVAVSAPIVPTQNASFRFIGGSQAGLGIEVDKLNGTVIFQNTTVKSLDFQSPGVEDFQLINSSVTLTLNGTGKKSTIAGSTVANFAPGAHSFGASGEVIVSNSTLTAINNGGASGSHATTRGIMSAGVLAIPKRITFSAAANDGTGQVKVTVASSAAYVSGLFVSFSSATPSCAGNFSITVPDSTHIVLVGSTFVSTCTGSLGNNLNDSQDVSWTAVGANVFLGETHDFSGPGFQITDITEDATNIYFHTSLAGGFPTVPGPGTAITARVHPAPKFTCTNCISASSPDAADLSQPGAAGVPLWSYSKRTITTANGAPTTPVVPVWGALVSTNITVTSASTAGGTMNAVIGIGGVFVATAVGGQATWNPTVNAKVSSGTARVMTPTTTSGAQSGDNLVAPGAGTWMLNDQISDEFSSAPAGGDPVSTTIEIITNQGVVWP